MSPCPNSGELLWEPEKDSIETEFAKNVEEFLTAAKRGDRDRWIRTFFGEGYPLTLKDSVVILDIESKTAGGSGQTVLLCTACNRIYIQNAAYVNEWTCYEPRG